MPEPNVLRQQRNYLVCFDLTARREICEIGEVPTHRKHSRHSVAAVNMSTLTVLLKQRHFSCLWLRVLSPRIPKEVFMVDTDVRP